MSRGKHKRNTAPAIAFRLEEGARKIADVKQAIVDLRAIHGLGANAISVQNVAKRAGVSRAFIYAHPDLRAQISGKTQTTESLPVDPSTDPASAATSSVLPDALLKSSQSYEDTISAQATLISSLTRQNQKLQKALTNLEKELAKLKAENVTHIDEYKKWSVERDALYLRLAGLTDRE